MKILAVLILITSVTTGYALECYSCSNCGSSVGKVIKCVYPMGTSGCMKFIHEAGGTEIVNRFCATSILWDGCKEAKYGSIGGTVCYCTGDKCNPAASPMATWGAILLMAVFAMYINAT